MRSIDRVEDERGGVVEQSCHKSVSSKVGTHGHAQGHTQECFCRMGYDMRYDVPLSVFWCFSCMSAVMYLWSIMLATFTSIAVNEMSDEEILDTRDITLLTSNRKAATHCNRVASNV